MQADNSNSSILRLGMKTIRAKQAKVQFAFFWCNVTGTHLE